MGEYLRILGRPGVAWLAASAATSRITSSMLGLALMLAVVATYGSYASAGLALSAHAIALALCAPVVARLADLRGSRRVLLWCVGLQLTAYAALFVVLLWRPGVLAVVVAAAAIGATNPPASPITRAQWPRLVKSDQLPAAYAFDSALNSSMFVAGPLIAAALTLIVPPYAVVALAGLSKITGDLMLASIRGLAAKAPAFPGTRTILGPLADKQVCLLLVAIALDTFTLGALNVGALAATGAAGWSGILLSAVAAGEVLGSLAYGSRRWPGSFRSHLVLLHGFTAVLLVVVGASAVTIPLLGVLYLVVGLTTGGRDTVNQLALGDYARPEHRIEAFAWLSTVMWVGFGLGTAVSGVVKSGLGTAWIYFLAAVVGVLAATTVSFLRRRPAPIVTKTPV